MELKAFEVNTINGYVRKREVCNLQQTIKYEHVNNRHVFTIIERCDGFYEQVEFVFLHNHIKKIEVVSLKGDKSIIYPHKPILPHKPIRATDNSLCARVERIESAVALSNLRLDKLLELHRVQDDGLVINLSGH